MKLMMNIVDEHEACCCAKPLYLSRNLVSYMHEFWLLLLFVIIRTISNAMLIAMLFEFRMMMMNYEVELDALLLKP